MKIVFAANCFVLLKVYFLQPQRKLNKNAVSKSSDMHIQIVDTLDVCCSECSYTFQLLLLFSLRCNWIGRRDLFTFPFTCTPNYSSCSGFLLSLHVIALHFEFRYRRRQSGHVWVLLLYCAKGIRLGVFVRNSSDRRGLEKHVKQLTNQQYQPSAHYQTCQDFCVRNK